MKQYSINNKYSISVFIIGMTIAITYSYLYVYSPLMNPPGLDERDERIRNIVVDASLALLSADACDEAGDTINADIYYKKAISKYSQISPPINALAKTKIRFALMLFKDARRTNEAIYLLMSAKQIYMNNKSGKDVDIVQGIINQHKKE